MRVYEQDGIHIPLQPGDVDGNEELIDEWDVLPTDWDPCVEDPIEGWTYPDYDPDPEPTAKAIKPGLQLLVKAKP